MIPLPLLLIGAVSATTPGGWRVQAALPETSASIRPVAVLRDPVGDVLQATADLRVDVGLVSLDAELPLVATWGDNGRWSHRHPGQARLGAFTWLFHEHFQVGLEGAFPVTGRDGYGQSWGSLSKEVLPSLEFGPSFHTLWATENFNVTARVFLGLRWELWETEASLLSDTGSTLSLDGAVAFTRHLEGPLGFVGELELVSDAYVPVTTRVLARFDLPIARGWLALDLGLQLPVTTIFDYVVFALEGEGEASIQPCAQIRWYPVLDWPWPGTHFDS